MNPIIYKRADLSEELYGILELQQQNIRENTSEDEHKKEGFVTVKHDFGILNKMNTKSPHVIAKHNDKVIGYALVMLQDFKDEIPLLKPMFNEVSKLITHSSYFAMGQVCVDKNYRKQGVFRGLYNTMKNELKNDYKMVITEVDATNQRSLHAHFAIGFKQLKTHQSQGQDWHLIYWDWT